jgi:sialate O-acetylesterase
MARAIPTFVLVLLASLASPLCRSARAEVKLPAVIGSHMVLQQQSDVAIWGFAEAGESVTVTPSWTKSPASAKADASGRWRVSVKTPKAGGPFTIEVAGSKTSAPLKLDDVLVGEVWLCGGQSNMEWAFAFGGVKNLEAERAAANDPMVRLFDVPNVIAVKPQSDCKTSWSAATPQSVNSFSCVGWFFARELRKALDVPIGLVGVNWGGTVAQAWTSREALASFPRFQGEIAQVEKAASDSRSVEEQQRAANEAWWKQLGEKDLGVRNGWAAKEFDDSKWTASKVPGKWSGDLANFDGVVWYRRSIELPSELAGQELALDFCPIDDMDTVWFDGTKVGGLEIPGAWNQLRHYTVPASLATAGRHVLALRVVDTGGDGGAIGEAKDCVLRRKGAEPRVELAGEWRMRSSLAASDFPPPVATAQPNSPNIATVLFNGMVAPIVPFGIRGALWYQGESNRGFAAEYARLMPALIADWRARFERPDFPFYFVQIAPFNYGDATGAATAQLRQAQTETLKSANTGMVVTMDIGDPGNIHPQDKQEVGRRLSLWALAKTYGKDVGECCGPLFESATVEGSKIRVKFSHAKGLVARGGAPTEFEVRAADGPWTKATAAIDGESVLVSSDAVAKPAEVRFGHADACAPNLFNGAGLPASPFCRIEQ